MFKEAQEVIGNGGWSFDPEKLPADVTPNYKYFQAIQSVLNPGVINSPLKLYKSTEVPENGTVNFWNKNLHQTDVKSFKGAGAQFMMMREVADNCGLDFIFVACSAGNHAQGVALAARLLERKAIIFMPEGTSKAKVTATEKLGGEFVEIKEHGNSFEETKKASEEYLAEVNGIYVPPYDHEDVIAGQGVHFFEVQEQIKMEVDIAIMGGGGGGLIAGSLLAREALGVNTRIIGVEQVGADCIGQALKAGEPVTLDSVNGYSQGTAVARIGDETFKIINRYFREGDRMVTVNNGEIADATTFWTRNQETVETAGALGTAALIYSAEVQEAIDETLLIRDRVDVVNFLTGGNITAEEKVQRAHEAEIFTQNRRYIQLEIPEHTPGNLQAIAESIRHYSINIVEFFYSSHAEVSDEGGQVIKLGLKHDKEPALTHFLEKLNSRGYRWNEVSRDEAEKVKDCVEPGQKDFDLKMAAQTPDYYKFKIRLKQRPGSLLDLIQQVPEELNVEFFSYQEKSPEDDRGKVEIGFSGPEKDIKAVREILKDTDPKLSKPERVQALRD